MVMVLMAVLAATAAVRWNTTDSTAGYQADLLARNIRHMQMLAMTWGQSLRLTVTSGSYSVRCVTPGVAPCNVVPVIDPATGRGFAVALENGVTLTGNNFDVDSLGRPVSGGVLLTANQTLTVSGATPVTVHAITGYVQ